MGLGSLSFIYTLSSSFVHMICYQSPLLLGIKIKGSFQVFFSLYTFDRTPNWLFFPEISLLNALFFFKPLIENLNMFFFSFAISSLTLLFFVCWSCRKSLCLFFRYSCVFSRFFILAKLLFFLLGLQPQSWILFIGILPFLGFPTTSLLFSNICP